MHHLHKDGSIPLLQETYNIIQLDSNRDKTKKSKIDCDNTVKLHFTCSNSFSFICLPMLSDVLRKRIVGVWCTQKCLYAESNESNVIMSYSFKK